MDIKDKNIVRMDTENIIENIARTGTESKKIVPEDNAGKRIVRMDRSRI